MKTRDVRTFAVRSAGQSVVVHSEGRTMHHDLLSAAGSPDQVASPGGPGRPDVEIWVEHERRDFDGDFDTVVTRGVHVQRGGGGVLVRSAGGSGHTQWWSAGEHLRVRARWRPSPPERAAAALLPSRRRALQAQILLHYPTLWWAGVRGMAPLHAAVVALDGVVVMLAGPGGVGKSTLLAPVLADGNAAMSDNLAVSDGLCAHGLAEPMRLEAAQSSRAHWAGPVGARTTHGRRDHAWGERPPTLVPDLVVAVRRGAGDRAEVRAAPPANVARALVAGTFGAGELRRYWPLCATLALATGLGPEVPPVVDVARRLTERVPCLDLALGRHPGESLRDVLAGPLAEIRRQVVPS